MNAEELIREYVEANEQDFCVLRVRELTLEKEAKPGTGVRFKKLAGELKKKGAKDPAALAAFIGRKKFGKKKFQQMAAAGRKK